MDIIHLLPDSVANQIAAGEVIQRPASVIKELVENAVDAGSTQIDVFVEDAGKTCIQVIDNGKGMTETDARLAFERHATSKIQKAEDLFSLRTMGFRGEALPSIAAVAQVRLTSRTPEHELGTQLYIEGSHVVSQEVCSCPIGSNFEVRNLFFNMPARRKFLKTNQTELNNVIQEFEHIVLVNPSVSFSLTHNGSLISKLPSSNQKQRILDVFGKKLNEQLLSVDVETTLVNISGFIGKPESAKKKGAQQYFFVNGRYMRHPYFHKAVQEAFDQLIPAGEQVPYFLYFQVDPANIDVNIHPTKTEIKFENETSIWQIIIAAIRETLGRFNAVPTMDFDTEGKPDIPVFRQNEPMNVGAPRPVVDVNYNPFRGSTSSTSRSTRNAINWDKLYEGLEKSTFPEDVSPKEDETELEQDLYQQEEGGLSDISSEHFQFKATYIFTAIRSGLMTIDQHRAHIRILYDQYRAQMKGKTVSTQGLLFPEMIQLSASDALLMEGMTDELHKLGFDLSPLGGGSFAINGVPQGLEGINPSELLMEMVASARDDGASIENDIQHKIALTMARRAAIVSGQVLSNQEMEDLINNLFASSNPNYTPNGKAIIAILQQDEIEERFGKSTN